MYKSFKEYMPVVFSRWWAMIAGIVSTIIGIISSVKQGFVIPAWIWFVMAIAFLSIAQFLAFHKVRQERDAAKGDVDSVIQKLRNLKLTIEGKTVSVLDILLKLQGELGRGVQKYEATRAIVGNFGGSITSEQLTLSSNEVFDKLNILGIIKLELHREGKPVAQDVQYWVLADLGKKVINSIKGCSSA